MVWWQGTHSVEVDVRKSCIIIRNLGRRDLVLSVDLASLTWNTGFCPNMNVSV